MGTPSPPPTAAVALIGRASEIDAVAGLIASARLVTLTGPPGVGKTRLALGVAADLSDRFPGGVRWVDLGPVREPGHVTIEIARALDGADPDALLVLDNVEHVLAVAPDIGDLLRSTSQLRVLATSRERLRLSAEREFPVPPLAVPGDVDERDWQQLRAVPAVALLLARAPANVSPSRGSVRALAEICVQLDGLPLAIELAAARLRVFTPAELAFRLEHRMATLTGGPRDAPARHRDLRAAIAWSHDLLSDRDRRALHRLSVFPDDWTIAAAVAVCAEADTADAIESLLDKSLIQRVATAEQDDDAEARFRMLMSIREFAGELLDPADPARANHASYFAAEARSWEQTAGTAEENNGWDAFGRMRADLIVAFNVAPDIGADTTLWLGAGLAWYWYTRGSVADAAPLIARVAAASAEPDASPDACRAGLLAAGVCSYARRELDTAEHLLGTVVRLAEATGDARRVAIATAFCGHVARDRGAYDEATRCYRAAREISTQLGNTRGLAWAAHDLGLLAYERGDDEHAETELRAAAQLFTEVDYGWARAGAERGLALVLIRRGALDEATAALASALYRHDQLGDRRGIAECLEGLAEVALARGSAAHAARLFGGAQSERTRGAAPPTDAERQRLATLDRRLARTLGPTASDHEQHAGRTMPHAAVLEIAARVTATDDGAPAAVQLTARQAQVADLVAAGQTNRQIGRTLGISEKTVEIHVHNVMARVAATSRAGVAAWVVRQRTP